MMRNRNIDDMRQTEIECLSNEELTLLSDFLTDLEVKTLAEQGLKNISGAFAEAEYFDYDNNVIDIDLKFGVISDCENVTYNEQLQLDRETFIIIN